MEKKYMDYDLNMNLISRIGERLNIREMVTMHGYVTSRLRVKDFFTAEDYHKMDALVKQASKRWLKKEKEIQ